MPLLSDDAQDFVRVTEGAIKVLDEHGVGGLTWLAVARAAEMSPSAVRHRCDLSRDRLIHLTVLALRRALAARLDEALGSPWLVSAQRRQAHQDTAGPEAATDFLVKEAMARLPRGERDRRDSRVWWLLAREPALPDAARNQIAAALDEQAQWCRAVMLGDMAAGTHLELLLGALDQATSRADDPLDLAIAEDLVRRVCRVRRQVGPGPGVRAGVRAEGPGVRAGVRAEGPADSANLPPTAPGLA